MVQAIALRLKVQRFYSKKKPTLNFHQPLH